MYLARLITAEIT